MATSAQIMDLATQYHATGNMALAEKYALSIIAEEPNHAAALHLLGQIARQQDKPAEALAYLNRSLTAQGSNGLVWQHAGDLLLAAGDLAGGISYYEQALRLRPDFAEGYNTVGMALMRVGQVARAVECYRRATRLAPTLAPAHNNLGGALRQQGRLSEAIAAYEQAQKLWPDSPDIVFNLGNTLYDHGNWQEAIACFRRALSLKPAYAAEVRNSLATALRKLGLWEEAVAEYQEALRLHPGHGMAIFNLSEMAVAGRYTFRPEDLADAKEIAATGPIGEVEGSVCERSRCAFAVAHVLGLQGAFDEAFRYYQEANDLESRLLQKRKTDFNARTHRANIDRLIHDHDRSYFELVREWGAHSDLPIFLVGLPLSGVGLAEEVLACHPKVHNAGAAGSLLRFLARSGAIKSSGATTAQILPDMAAARTAAAGYLEHLTKDSRAADRVLVNNFDNGLTLGMIATLFPAARVIRCRRQPLDMALAWYFQNRRDLPFSVSLDDIGAYYLAHEKLMAHWAEVSPLRIHDVTYEDLIQNREQTARALLAFCGLDWDARCGAGAGEPRIAAVGDGIDHSRPYRDHVGPLIRALEG